ncbi:MAG: transposase [Bryobacterales bacterium]|nr:transposase [Bryobacterales bacterium]
MWERIHCLRGDAENRFKELKAGLGPDRETCNRFLANGFRVLLAAAAQVLLQNFLLKVVVWVRRVLLHLPQGAPAQAEWLTIVRRLGGVGPSVAGVRRL